jgi:hypothetical protein
MRKPTKYDSYLQANYCNVFSMKIFEAWQAGEKQGKQRERSRTTTEAAPVAE